MSAAASMTTRFSTGGAVAAANHLAASAGAATLARGGNAVDAAIAAGAVMAVTSPHMCGLGGDVFAVVVSPGEEVPAALNASGRAGSGADPDRVRAGGHRAMPFSDEIATVTTPGCVDGLVALQARFATLALADLLAPARRLAADGFPVSATLAAGSSGLPADLRERMFGAPGPLVAGQRLALPRLARTLDLVAAGGRAGFYEGSAGEELIAVGAGEFSEADLRAPMADWVTPAELTALGRRLWTIPPNSQGYLALSGAWIAGEAGLAGDPEDGAWAAVLVEAARQAGYDRNDVLHEHADPAGLLAPDRLAPRADAVPGTPGRGLRDTYADGDTTYLCAVDGNRMGVSLILSNCAGFGSHLVLEDHGVFLHNRGMGFSLEPDHPAGYGPGRRPPHTLSPLAVTTADGALDAVLGTMGGDAQPQIVLQLLARTLVAGQNAGAAVHAPRWCLAREPTNGFDTWRDDGLPVVQIEQTAPHSWAEALSARGYQVRRGQAGAGGFGHAHMIRVGADDVLCGAADPRALDGAFVAG